MSQSRLAAAFLTVLTGAAGCGDGAVVAERVPPSQVPPYDEGLPGDARLAPLSPADVAQLRSFLDGDDTDPEEPAPPPPDPEEPPAPPAEPEVPADCAQVRVVGTGGVTLNVRPEPSTAQAAVGALSPGEIVDVVGVVDDGESVNGNATWYEIVADGGALEGFVSGAFASCIDPNAPPPEDGFYLPLECGRTTTVTQGNNSAFSHNGNSAFAFDFSLPRGTPLVAIADGVVLYADGDTQPGDPCWSGGGQSCASEANYIIVEHVDGSGSVYAHLDSPSLDAGDVVLRGEQVGLSGGTGWSTGPHAHVARIELCGSPWCASIPMEFVDFGGVPQTGDEVTSGNCP